MKNSLADLNNILFETLERLNDEELNLDQELQRAKAVADVGSKIIEIGKTQLEAMKMREEFGMSNKELPALLATKDSKAAIEQKGELHE